LSRDAARATRVWRRHKERRTPKTGKRGKEASQGRKEGKGKVARSLHSPTSTPPFPLSFRPSFVALSSTITPSSGPPLPSPLDFDGQWWTMKLTYLVL
jgi:hypothetical protein